MKAVWQPLLLLALLYLLVSPDLDLRFRLEYLYFLFSGAVAWSCYRLMIEAEIH
jgi:ABC-type polysaccharide/polyol phosphate export permease